MAANSGSSNNKVKLISAQNPSRRVTLRASPTVTENRNVNYSALEPLHAPGQIQVYRNTSSRSFGISDIRLISRTAEEADANLRTLWRLRAWCMPRFGNSSTLTDNQRDNRANPYRDESQYDESEFKNHEEYIAYTEVGTELLGAPPEVLYLSAYSHNIGSDPAGGGKSGTKIWQAAQHINRVPVVIQQLTIPYPNDVDYINTSKGVPMPIIMNLDISLIETHSPNAYEAFSLNDFRSGTLRGF